VLGEFIRHHPDLLSKEALLAYYPADVLQSARARRSFVLNPLAGVDREARAAAG
jgi:hypothetical protein